jgi:3-hydroxymyristoyl/3-hydroxydecanoyl-(acyl carrier protein) dehydratase/predicted hotdog family 3-hydroxylacyl-ACP dehydratase
MLLIQELAMFSGGEATAIARVQDCCPFLMPDGSLDPLAHIELLAQTAAALSGMERRQAGEGPWAGMLVGVRDYSAPGIAGRGDELRIAVRRGASHEELVVFSGEVFGHGMRLAAGELRVFLSPTAVAPVTTEATRPMGSIHPLIPRFGQLGSAPGSASFVVDEGFPAFAGHFPGRPILPAVAIAALAVETARSIAGGAATLRSLSYAKFRRPVAPGKRLDVQCCRQGAERPSEWTAGVRMEDAAVAELSFELSPP